MKSAARSHPRLAGPTATTTEQPQSDVVIAWLGLSDGSRSCELRPSRDRDRSAPEGSRGRRRSRGRIPRISAVLRSSAQVADVAAMRSPAAIAALPHHPRFVRRSFRLTPTRSDCQTAPMVCSRTAVPLSLGVVWRNDDSGTGAIRSSLEGRWRDQAYVKFLTNVRNLTRMGCCVLPRAMLVLGS
jgi:hypothetical protein